MSRWLAARRSIDVILACLGLVTLWPIVLMLAVVVTVSDGRSPFVQLERVGRDGVTFGMWKIRSMSAAGKLGATITAGADRRVTWIGTFMRQYRLDEIPQLLHVIQGQMSLIGPRPEDLSFVDMNEPLWKQTLQSRPGIAGLTQIVAGPWEAQLPETDTELRYVREILPAKLQIDAWYVRNASPTTDAVVCWSLVAMYLGRRRTTAAHRLIGKHLPELPTSFEFDDSGSEIDLVGDTDAEIDLDQLSGLSSASDNSHADQVGG